MKYFQKRRLRREPPPQFPASSSGEGSRSRGGGGSSFPYSTEKLMILALLAVSQGSSHAFTPSSHLPLHPHYSSILHRPSPSSICMVMSLPDKDLDTSSWSNGKEMSLDQFQRNQKNKVRKKYKRRRIPETEKEHLKFKRERQAEYEQLISNAKGGANIWSFEQLFPEPFWDDETIKRDLFAIKKQDTQTTMRIQQNNSQSSQQQKAKMKTSAIGASSMMRVWREPKLSSYILPYDLPSSSKSKAKNEAKSKEEIEDVDEDELARTVLESSTGEPAQIEKAAASSEDQSLSERLAAAAVNTTVAKTAKVNYEMTRRVEDKIYGYRRGTNTYDTSLMGDGAIKFREGVRLGNALPINAARLNYFAKKELRKDRVEEARELYEKAIQIDPRDGRAYLGLSKCAERRRDFKLARECLLAGIQNAVSVDSRDIPDRGANPFLLQALGVLEEKKGHLAQAEALYIEAAKSRPSHAAAWVALAQIRTRKFRQGAAAGRVCYQRAEQELQNAGLPVSAYVYTAWASMEYKKAGDIRRARELYKLALAADPKCSAAWLQLGVMEANNENWKEAELCFETVLKFDQRNSRVLQAYAIMETKRAEGDSRKAIGLFERALKVNPRDAGVLQPYALYVAELGDIDSARDLLRRGTEVNKRHAPVWQAWGVLETRHGNPDEARSIFQEGIWACAQLAGGQSGGYKCARLWQAWGVLEAMEQDYAAARRCFSRALDADNRNVAAITAWTQMEEDIGNVKDAGLIFERSLKQFAPGTDEKMQLWRAYELMEQRAGNYDSSQEIYRRYMQETIVRGNVDESAVDPIPSTNSGSSQSTDAALLSTDKNENGVDGDEVEVSRWDDGSSRMKAEVWMNDGMIEGRVPDSAMKRMRRQQKQQANKMNDGSE